EARPRPDDRRPGVDQHPVEVREDGGGPGHAQAPARLRARPSSRPATRSGLRLIESGISAAVRSATMPSARGRPIPSATAPMIGGPETSPRYPITLAAAIPWAADVPGT